MGSSVKSFLASVTVLGLVDGALGTPLGEDAARRRFIGGGCGLRLRRVDGAKGTPNQIGVKSTFKTGNAKTKRRTVLAF